MSCSTLPPRCARTINAVLGARKNWIERSTMHLPPDSDNRGGHPMAEQSSDEVDRLIAPYKRAAEAPNRTRSAPTNRPEIKLEAGELRQIVDAMEGALLEAGENLFQQ